MKITSTFLFFLGLGILSFSAMFLGVFWGNLVFHIGDIPRTSIEQLITITSMIGGVSAVVALIFLIASTKAAPSE